MRKRAIVWIAAAAVCLFTAGCRETSGAPSASGQMSSSPASSSAAVSSEVSSSPAASSEVSSSDAELESAADALLASMASGDFASVANWAEGGTVAFTPYSTVNPDCDRAVTADELARFGTDNTVYTWGIYDGSGEDIQLTPKEYWDRFVWTTDFSKVSTVSVNETHAGGNSVENVEDAYPGCSYVEYYCDGIDPQYGGADWCALKLVFTSKNGGLQLCGIIHSEWTP